MTSRFSFRFAALALVRGVMLLTALASTAASAVEQSGMVFEDWNSTSIITKSYSAPDWTFTITTSPGSVAISGAGPAGGNVQFTFNAPLGQPVVPGAYEDAYVDRFPSASPTMDFSTVSACTPLMRIVVLEADLTNVPKRFAANIQLACPGVPRPMMREVRINSAIPFSSEVVGTATLPDAMAFESRNAVRAGSQQVSNETIVYGINVPVPISITDGEYSLNGGAYTAAPGTASKFDRLRVRTKASPVPGATRVATLQAGSRATTFTVNTYGPGATASGLYFKQIPTGSFSPYATFFPAPASLITSSASASKDFVGLRLKAVRESGEFHTDFKTPLGAPIAPGAYENAQRYPFQPGGTPGLSFYAFSFMPISCNTLTGRFVVHEATFAGDGTVQRFAADFEQRCDSFGSELHTGQVRFNSLVPFGFSRGRYVGLDVSGEGFDDLLWQHTDGRHAAWLMNGLTPTSTAEILAAASGWNVTHTGDFDADGRTDLVWQHPDGRMAIWLMNGLAPSATQQLLDAGGRTVVHVADLNGDGKPDLVLRNADGTTALWIMDGLTATSQATLAGTGGGWSVARTGDFDGDGKADLLWKHTDGRVAIWLMNGTAVTATNQILNAGTGWSPVHVADLDGDGKSDIVWQHTDGTIAAWLMNGTAMASGSGILGAGSGWSVARTADFDGDGRADLYFEHTDGRAAIWLMEGLKATQQTQILNAGSGWSLRRIVDLNADGKADIVWRHTDGRHAAWLMDGVAMTSGQGILGPGTGWSVLGDAP
ncbi:hypothetical protein BWI17_14715 [Betaproteobacteria bacterium GR16-43]|nr:hypothetical protein BWI17_14715 [Betaproteobacteria bacterium GR16-43]